nr:uncharacterized protein LOC127309062 [Lolium perenne]
MCIEYRQEFGCIRRGWAYVAMCMSFPNQNLLWRYITFVSDEAEQTLATFPSNMQSLSLGHNAKAINLCKVIYCSERCNQCFSVGVLLSTPKLRVLALSKADSTVTSSLKDAIVHYLPYNLNELSHAYMLPGTDLHGTWKGNIEERIKDTCT